MLQEKEKEKKKDKHVKEFCESVNLEDCIRETVNMFSVTRKNLERRLQLERCTVSLNVGEYFEANKIHGNQSENQKKVKDRKRGRLLICFPLR